MSNAPSDRMGQRGAKLMKKKTAYFKIYAFEYSRAKDVILLEFREKRIFAKVGSKISIFGWVVKK